ncbi:MAG: hypothetical protein Q4G33_13550, partial [bacterium]|nr:hypothetical protein [bacterium]
EVKERVTKLEESNLEIKVQLDKLRADIQVIGEAHQMSFAHAMEAETLAKTVRAQQEMQNIRLNRIECDIERFKLRMEM